MSQGYDFIGRHFIANYVGCDAKALTDHEALLKVLAQAATAGGATVMQTSSQAFEGGGLTAVLVLCESHASIHTYPERAACFIDFFTCGLNCDPERFHEVLHKYLTPVYSSSKILLRDAGISEVGFPSQILNMSPIS